MLMNGISHRHGCWLREVKYKMLFLVLLKISPECTAEAIRQLKQLTISVLPKGVTIRGCYEMLGEYDVSIWLESPDEKAALDLITGRVRCIPGVSLTETLITREV